MDMNKYQLAAARTINKEASAEKNLNNFVYGLVGETGEVIDLLKKNVFHKHPLDKTALTKELGDLLWYLSAIATHYNILMNDVANVNIAKLRERYPNGFNVNDSINREV